MELGLDGNSTMVFENLEKEFTSIYVFNLRGNQRTSGELCKKKEVRFSVEVHGLLLQLHFW